MSTPTHRMPHPAPPTLTLADMLYTQGFDQRPVQAAACVPTGTHTLDLTLTQGKYHQVKRMLAAVGNRVEGLHRSRIGALDLPADLPPGQWRWLQTHELDLLQSKASA